MVLGIMLYKAILTFESGCGILNSVIIQMKATEKYFHVVLCNVVQGGFKFEASIWMKSSSVTTEVKATKQHFPVKLFKQYVVHCGVGDFECLMISTDDIEILTIIIK